MLRILSSRFRPVFRGAFWTWRFCGPLGLAGRKSRLAISGWARRSMTDADARTGAYGEASRLLWAWWFPARTHEILREFLSVCARTPLIQQHWKQSPRVSRRAPRAWPAGQFLPSRQSPRAAGAWRNCAKSFPQELWISPRPRTYTPSAPR